MDRQTVIVSVGGLAFCAVVGYIVYVFRAKEQTYKEALEAQKAKKESKKPSQVKNSDVNNKGDGADKNDAVSDVVIQKCCTKQISDCDVLQQVLLRKIDLGSIHFRNAL